ncbi:MULTISPECIES: restriction endonuclease subunit S [unclassified Rhodanobacter]|uniref:Restriction endonuclease subunit S n=1 Tax=Rhodanobacter humi TaxID=1888173 RepID=A0ABV4APC5_9GAMM
MTIFDCPLPVGWKREPIAANYRITKKPRTITPTPAVLLPFVAMEKVPAGGQMTCGFELRTPDAIASGTYFEMGDILLSKITPSFENGKQGLANGLPGTFGYGSTELIPLQACTDKAINPYLFYLLLHHEVRDSLTSKMEGSTGRKRVPEGAVRELEVPVPPKLEQQKIAAVLWKIQRAIATQDRLIAATRNLKQSTMQHLFTHGLRGEPLKDTAIGPMPESWKVVALGDFGRIGNGSTPKKTTPEYWRSPTTPWLTSAKVHDGIIRSADQFVSDAAVKECHLPIVPAGSLLVAITGQGKTLGNSALVEFDTTISQHMAYVRFDHDGAVPGYVYQFMRSRYEELQSVGRAGGSTKAALTCAFLRDYRLPLPPTNEQRDIAAALATIDRKLALHQKKRAALNDLFQTTLHRLMTAQIRVADLDIDTSEVSNHFPDAGKMVLKSATTTGDQFVDANKMIDAKNPAMRRNQIADVSKKVGSAKSRTADGDV